MAAAPSDADPYDGRNINALNDLNGVTNAV